MLPLPLPLEIILPVEVLVAILVCYNYCEELLGSYYKNCEVLKAFGFTLSKSLMPSEKYAMNEFVCSLSNLIKALMS